MKLVGACAIIVSVIFFLTALDNCSSVHRPAYESPFGRSISKNNYESKRINVTKYAAGGIGFFIIGAVLSANTRRIKK